ncbi:ABC transporter ATP-binding protein [candidate division KSB1 bacterium]|nr:ABC transporter ATP-binding protein [candidate division KSB1 bacterium]MBL7095139.1 ABC transporter ATP-binding protein [candidate division KSB1 bacterium]
MNVSLKNFTITYGDVTAIDQVTVDFPEGSTGLLGINGAGKTSLIKALLGLVPFATGSGNILGKDIINEGKIIRQLVGYMPENDCLIPGFNGVGMVQYAGELCGMSCSDALQRAHEVLFYVGLEEARYRNVETYSAGMKQRIKLAQAFVHDPKLLFLDEPTTGMDPKGRGEMLELISDVSSRKEISVILSSHILLDVERTCERVVILHQGKVVEQGSISELKGKHSDSYTVRVIGNRKAFETELVNKGCEVEPDGQHFLDVGLPSGKGTELILSVANKTEVQLRQLTASIRSLEDVFVKLIGAVN